MGTVGFQPEEGKETALKELRETGGVILNLLGRILPPSGEPFTTPHGEIALVASDVIPRFGAVWHRVHFYRGSDDTLPAMPEGFEQSQEAARLALNGIINGERLVCCISRVRMDEISGGKDQRLNLTYNAQYQQNRLAFYVPVLQAFKEQVEEALNS